MASACKKAGIRSNDVAREETLEQANDAARASIPRPSYTDELFVFRIILKVNRTTIFFFFVNSITDKCSQQSLKSFTNNY